MKHSHFLMLFLIISIMILNLPYAVLAETTIDNTLIEVFFNQFNSLDPDTKDIALDLLRTVYFPDNDGLDQFKEDINILLPKEYKEKLSNNGISMSDVDDMIDELKLWPKNDRMRLISYVENKDEEAVIELLEKHEILDNDEGSVESSSGQVASPANNSSSPSTAPLTPITMVDANFKDMENHWAKDVVSFLAGKGIVKGKTQSEFVPDGYITRAEFTALLVRVMGIEDTLANDGVFDDVKPDDWFYNAVNAGYKTGLVKGTAVNKFEPYKNITREEMAVLIARAAAFMNKVVPVDSVEIGNIVAKYIDGNMMHDWAQTGIVSAVKTGLMSGQGNGLFNPQGLATRAESATVIYNLYQLIN